MAGFLDKVYQICSGYELKIVFDIDDTLNNLNDFVCTHLGISRDKLNKYSIEKCENLTKQQKEAILLMYNDIETFKNLYWVSGAERIEDFHSVRIGRFCTGVYIHSTSMTEEIADYKRVILKRDFPIIPDKNISLEYGSNKKSCFNDAFIVVEDNIENLLKYPDGTIKILIDKPNNKDEIYGVNPNTSGIIRVVNLSSALNVISSILNVMQMTQEKFN